MNKDEFLKYASEIDQIVGFKTKEREQTYLVTWIEDNDLDFKGFIE
jgi:hypothetical protein